MRDQLEGIGRRLAERRPPVRVAGSARRARRGHLGTVFDQRGVAVVRWLVVDCVAILALMLLVTLAWLPTYGGGWLWVASLGGAVTGLAVAGLSALRRLSTAVTALVAVVAYGLLGTFLAMPSAGLAFVVPTLRSVQGLLAGPVLGWKGMLTVDAPIGETSHLLVPVVLTGMVAALAALTISLRSGRPLLGWLPPAAALVLAFSLGVGTSWQPAWVGLAFLVVVLLWTTYRRGQQRRALVHGNPPLPWSTVVIGALVLALTGGTAVAAAPLLASGEGRRTFREAVKPPLDIHRYPSPLQGFRLNHTDNKEKTLFTISGAPQGTRVRLATLDAYDGFTYNVTDIGQQAPGGGAFKRIGERVDDRTVGQQVTVQVTIGDYAGVWVPTVGQTLQARFTGERGVRLADSFYYNEATGTAMTPVRLVRGDTYRLTAVVPDQPTTAQVLSAGAGAIELPPAEPVPDMVRDLAARWGAPGAGAAVSSYRDHLKEGYYSNGVVSDDPDDQNAPSAPGHSEQRLETLLADTAAMVGDEEQYAVTMALLARTAGVPARVGYGYVTKQAGTVSVRGEDVTAWTEVYLEPYGWVVIDPTPPKDRKLPKPPEQQQSVPRPQVENPPPPPERPEKNDRDDTPPVQPAPQPNQRPRIDWGLIGTVALVGGLPLLTVVLPIAVIIGLKMRRRRERMAAADLVERVSGGWSELVDRARDLGRSPSPSATRTEQADQLLGEFRRLGEEVDPRILARQADATVFSPDAINANQAATYWRSIDSAIVGLNRSVGWGRRLGGALSIRSFRRPRTGRRAP